MHTQKSLYTVFATRCEGRQNAKLKYAGEEIPTHSRQTVHRETPESFF